MNRLNNFAITIALALGTSSAQAATINLASISGPVASGRQVTFNIVADFGAQSVLAGGTDYSWDSSVLTLADFSFSPALASPAHRDSDFDAKTHPGSAETFDLRTPSLLSIAFGRFAGLSIPAGTVLGTLTFNAVGVAGSSSLISLTDSQKWDGYFDATPNPQPITVTYTDATAQILPQTVPLPAAAWLLGSGMLSLLGAARRRSRAS